MPIMFGVLLDLTGVRTSAFMLMFGVVWVSLIWMYWTEVRPVKISRHHERQASKQAASI
jgi:MFS transporter, NNP family, nitrate/nitrite transporter